MGISLTIAPLEFLKFIFFEIIHMQKVMYQTTTDASGVTIGEQNLTATQISLGKHLIRNRKESCPF